MKRWIWLEKALNTSHTCKSSLMEWQDSSSQSLPHEYRFLLWRLCKYSVLDAMGGQRDNSFEMRYVLMWRQWVLTVRAIMCAGLCGNVCKICNGERGIWECVSTVRWSAAPECWTCVLVQLQQKEVSWELMMSVCHLCWESSQQQNDNTAAFFEWGFCTFS